MRKQILFTLLSMLMGALTAAAIAAASTDTWDFRVLLDGKEIGSHRFDITGSGDARTLTSKARFNVRFLFVNAHAQQGHGDRFVVRERCRQ